MYSAILLFIVLAAMVAFNAASSINSLAIARSQKVLQISGGAKVATPGNDAEFDSLLKSSSGKIVVVNVTGGGADFASKITNAVFEQLAKAADSSSVGAVFLKVDVNKLPVLKAKFKIDATPTFLFLKNGASIEKIVKADAIKLKEAFKKHIKVSI